MKQLLNQTNTFPTCSSSFHCFQGFPVCLSFPFPSSPFPIPFPSIPFISMYHPLSFQSLWLLAQMLSITFCTYKQKWSLPLCTSTCKHIGTWHSVHSTWTLYLNRVTIFENRANKLTMFPQYACVQYYFQGHDLLLHTFISNRDATVSMVICW